jgi:TRAP transporter 4TM/12TM fusion protein
MPPIMGAAAFLMAEFLDIPYASVAAAALIPALLYYLSVFVQVDLIAGRDRIEATEAERLTVVRVLGEGWHFTIPFALLLAALFVWNWDPEKSALLAAVAVVIAGMLRGYRGQRLSLRALGNVFVETGVGMVDLILVVSAAGFVIGILNITGLGFALTLVLVDSVGSNLPALLAISALICTVLGMGMPTSGVYVLLASLVAPSLVKAGIEPISAHLFILYFGMMSMITPPVALAAFAAATITKDDPLKTGLASVRIGWAAFAIPFIFVATPAILLADGWVAALLAAVPAAVGIIAVTAGMVGFWGRRLGYGWRLLVTGLGLVTMPLGFLHGAEHLHLPFAAVLLLLAGLAMLRDRSRAETAST